MGKTCFQSDTYGIKTIFFLALVMLTFPCLVSAQGANEAIEIEKNALELFLGGTYADDDTNFSIGLASSIPGGVPPGDYVGYLLIEGHVLGPAFLRL